MPGDDARRAFLFESADGALLGVTLDRAGRNLPRDSGQEWVMKTEFTNESKERVDRPVAQ